MKIKPIFKIEEGILSGIEIEPSGNTVIVRYPHRKETDLFILPIEDHKKWHCCRENCTNPDFEGDVDALIEHLMIHY